MKEVLNCDDVFSINSESSRLTEVNIPTYEINLSYKEWEIYKYLLGVEEFDSLEGNYTRLTAQQLCILVYFSLLDCWVRKFLYVLGSKLVGYFRTYKQVKES